MPLEGVSLTPRAELLTLEERKRLITIFASLGVNKLRFTGGEPTVSNQLVELIQHASTQPVHRSTRSTGNRSSTGPEDNDGRQQEYAAGEELYEKEKEGSMALGMRSIGITSNGIVLKDKLDRLLAAGLSSVNISLDTVRAHCLLWYSKPH